jgi:hypothetical protein
MASSSIPYRQIRASYDSNLIIVYQAYNSEIARAAVEHQRLDASPKFSTTRMTWIKPSWAWMLYRCGYSFKDSGQERVLALSLTHATFESLLEQAVVSTHAEDAPDSGARAEKEGRSKSASVRVQWDPERTITLEKLPYRSIQIGIPGALVPQLVKGTVKIEDVTEKARELKRMLDERKDVSMAELVEKGLVPEEEVLEVRGELKKTLRMDQ